MVAFYCPACWSEVNAGDQICPACSANIAELSAQQDYVSKLIAALEHPEPTTPIRAAWILGQLKTATAVAPLLKVVRGSTDPYIKAAAAEALGEIGGQQAHQTLTELSTGGPVIVRRAAVKALARLSTPG
jgi:HEAT repeat protein